MEPEPPVLEPVPRSLHDSQLRLFSLNRVRTALRGASVANRRLRDSASTAASGGMTTSDYAQSERWCIEMLVTQINGDDPAVARAALSVLEEATQDERCLRTLVNRCLLNHDVPPPVCSYCRYTGSDVVASLVVAPERRNPGIVHELFCARDWTQVLAKPDLINKPGANDLLMRFLSIPEGILYLEEHGWVEQMVREWKDNGRTTTYAESVDTKWNVSWAYSAGSVHGKRTQPSLRILCFSVLNLSTMHRYRAYDVFCLQTSIKEMEHVEDTLHMDRMSKHENDASDSGVTIPIRASNM